MSYDYRRDSRGLRDVLGSREMQDAMVEVAEAGRVFAASIAPVDTGRYRDSFRVDRIKVRDRTGAAVVNDAPHAPLVESRLGVLSRLGDMLEKS